MNYSTIEILRNLKFTTMAQFLYIEICGNISF